VSPSPSRLMNMGLGLPHRSNGLQVPSPCSRGSRAGISRRSMALGPHSGQRMAMDPGRARRMNHLGRAVVRRVRTGPFEALIRCQGSSRLSCISPPIPPHLPRPQTEEQRSRTSGPRITCQKFFRKIAGPAEIAAWLSVPLASLIWQFRFRAMKPLLT
jgi:hypothetical protein